MSPLDPFNSISSQTLSVQMPVPSLTKNDSTPSSVAAAAPILKNANSVKSKKSAEHMFSDLDMAGRKLLGLSVP